MNHIFLLDLFRVIYVSIFASAFAAYLGKEPSADAVMLCIIFLLFLGFESAARAINCKQLLSSENGKPRINGLVVTTISIVLEFLAMVFAAHWVLIYLNRSIENAADLVMLPLGVGAFVWFLAFNLANNLVHIFAYWRNRFIELNPLYLLVKSVFGDLYEANYNCQVPFVAGAIRLDRKFNQQYERIRPTPLQENWYVFKRSLMNIAVQLFGLNLFLFHVISISLLLFPSVLIVSSAWVGQHHGLFLFVTFFFLMVVVVVMYFITTNFEIDRQEKRPDGTPYFPKESKPPKYRELLTQGAGNISLIVGVSYVKILMVIFLKNYMTILEAYAATILLFNFLVAMIVAALSQGPEAIKDIKTSVSPDGAPNAPQIV